MPEARAAFLPATLPIYLVYAALTWLLYILTFDYIVGWVISTGAPPIMWAGLRESGHSY